MSVRPRAILRHRKGVGTSPGTDIYLPDKC